MHRASGVDPAAPRPPRCAAGAGVCGGADADDEEDADEDSSRASAATVTASCRSGCTTVPSADWAKDSVAAVAGRACTSVFLLFW